MQSRQDQQKQRNGPAGDSGCEWVRRQQAPALSVTGAESESTLKGPIFHPFSHRYFSYGTPVERPASIDLCKSNI